MRLGLFEYQKNGLTTTLKDWVRSGVTYLVHHTGRAAGTMICITPAYGLKADLDARTELLLIEGTMGFATDVGTWGSRWVVRNGAWKPDGPIQGNGTPEAAITAPVGSLYLRQDGGAVTTLYVKESGAGNTGWVAK